MSKTISLVLVLVLTLSGLIVLNPALAQSAAPAVPEFTLKSVGNQTIAITIKNQPLNPSYSLFYNVRFKDHSDPDWTNMFPSDNYLSQSNSEYTVIYNYDNHPAGSQLDFQVEAILQNWTQIIVNDLVPGLPASYQSDNYGSYHGWIPIASSGWSNIQTLAIPKTASPPTPSANIPNTDVLPKPDPWTPLIAVLAVYLAIAVSPFILLHRLHRKTHVSKEKTAASARKEDYQ
jgi:hypothetical protein